MKSKGVLSEEVAINFGIQISEIIAYLHKQKPVPILYLDLKPQNIMIDNGRLYLVDFGNSMFLNSKRNYMSGTKGYAAPEQYEFTGIDFRTDIYGIGALLYFMVTGLVCNGSCHFDTNSLVSEAFKKIVIRCMSPKEERVRDALWVANNLNEIIHEKIRKNDVKKAVENLMEQPLVVSVIGAERHIGVTHFALALASRLSEKGIKTIYEDRSGRVIRSIYENSEKCRLSAGIYYYENVLMKHSYSEFIEIGENVNCKVIDCSGEGVAENHLDKADVVILLAGGKPWELEEAKVASGELQNIGVPKKMIFWNFMKDKTSDCIPLFCDPFHRDEDTNEFFDKVISRIFEEENAYKKEDRKRIFRFFTRKK